jgi:hypothetical protein
MVQSSSVNIIFNSVISCSMFFIYSFAYFNSSDLYDYRTYRYDQSCVSCWHASSIDRWCCVNTTIRSRCSFKFTFIEFDSFVSVGRMQSFLYLSVWYGRYWPSTGHVVYASCWYLRVELIYLVVSSTSAMYLSRFIAVLLWKYRNYSSCKWNNIFVCIVAVRYTVLFDMVFVVISALVNHWFGPHLEHKICLPIIDRQRGTIQTNRSTSRVRYQLLRRNECVHSVDQNCTNILFNRRQKPRYMCESIARMNSNRSCVLVKDDIHWWTTASTSSQCIGNA